LELNEQKRLIPIVRTPDHLVYDTVGIRFSASPGPEDVQGIEDRLREIAQLSVRTTEKPEWGLREYVLVAPKTDRLSGFEYVPMDNNFRSMDRGRMWIGCLAAGSTSELAKLPGNTGLYNCASHFNYRDESV
jgi:hypothetical protein